MDPSATVCPACGKAVGGATAPPPATATPAPAPPKSGGPLKVILIVVGSIFLLAFLVIALAVGGAFYMAQKSHVKQGPEGAKVETPFGTVETTTEDAEKIAARMGIEIYPGARPLPGSSSSVTTESMHIATVMYESDDPPEKVEEFYRQQFPNAMVHSEGEGADTHTVLAVGELTTISIEGREGGSRFTIASLKK
jgi:hypothetical protein